MALASSPNLQYIVVSFLLEVSPTVPKLRGAQTSQTLLVLTVAPLVTTFAHTGEPPHPVCVRLTRSDPVRVRCGCQTYRVIVEKHHEPFRAPVLNRVPGQGHL